MLKDKKHIILTSALLGTCGGVVFLLFHLYLISLAGFFLFWV